MIPGGVRTVNLIWGRRKKCPFLETDSLADTCFFTDSRAELFFQPLFFSKISYLRAELFFLGFFCEKRSALHFGSNFFEKKGVR